MYLSPLHYYCLFYNMLTNFLIVKAFVAHVDCQRRSCHFSLLGRNQRWLADAFCSAHNICAHLLCWVSSLLICFDCLGCSDSVLCIAIENCQNTWLVVHMNGGYSVFNNHPQPTNFVSYFTPVEEDKYQKDSFKLSVTLLKLAAYIKFDWSPWG